MGSSPSRRSSKPSPGTTKPAANTVAAYRRDREGVARRIAADAEVGVLDGCLRSRTLYHETVLRSRYGQDSDKAA